MSDEEFLEIEDLTENTRKKAKAKGKPKGKRGELKIVEILNKRFFDILDKNKDWGQFSRSIGSGNRWGQKVVLSKSAKETFTGDLTTPTNFKFVVEIKTGYNDIDLNSMFDNGHKEIDKFIKQVTDDSGRCERKPLLIWTKDRKPPIAFILKKDFPKVDFEYYISYNEWHVLSLDNLLKQKDDFFFSIKEKHDFHRRV